MGEGGQRPGEGASSLATRPSPLAPPSGRPYFVMELVKGIRITDYCDQNDLPTEDRLKLFMKVCHAVQHAHQKGIIHRDLKPSNMMVTLHDGEAVPKVIDFGIAKATGQRLTDKTLFTRYEQMIGTPAYMSPEQAAMSGLDVDTRTDIYALGVLLYELLTGVTPFDKETLAKAALDEIRRMIRETEPPKPSTRLHTMGETLTEVAKHRHTEPGLLRRSLRGDLDWIVMKALEKDRARRYETANALAEDIQRHRDHQPVVAGPPSTVYRAGKFIRRHRAGLAVGAALIVVLVLGTVVSTWQAVRAKRAEREQTRLREAAEKAQAGEASMRAEAEDARARGGKREEGLHRGRPEHPCVQIHEGHAPRGGPGSRGGARHHFVARGFRQNRKSHCHRADQRAGGRGRTPVYAGHDVPQNGGLGQSRNHAARRVAFEKGAFRRNE